MAVEGAVIGRRRERAHSRAHTYVSSAVCARSQLVERMRARKFFATFYNAQHSDKRVDALSFTDILRISR